MRVKGWIPVGCRGSGISFAIWMGSVNLGLWGGQYLNEYAISTFRTGYNLIAQMRGYVEDQCHAMSPYTPDSRNVHFHLP